MLRCLSYSFVSRSLGILLLAAAGLKLNGLAIDPVGRMGLFTLPAFQIAVVEFEIFLAVWLLWGRLPLGSWATALGVFTVFAGVSAYQGWIGRASCGCFGQLSVSPWYAFGIDVAVLLALMLGRPDLQSVRQQPPVSCCLQACNGDPTCESNCMQVPQQCPGQDGCAAGCSPNKLTTGCNDGCNTAAPNCTNCGCIVTQRDPTGAVLACGCR